MDNLVPVRLRFVRGEGFLSEAICAVTWSKWSHVEFWTPDGYLGAQVKGGIQVRPYDYCKVKAEAFAHVMLTPEQADGLWKFAYSQIGKPYDIAAIFGFLFHRDWAHQGKWFCSEFATASFIIGAQFPILNVANHEYVISPGLLALAPALVWEGGASPLLINS